MFNVMNVENDNNNTGHYPLFLGPNLGFSDEINITYPRIHGIYKRQQSMYWLEDEFHFNQDRIDLREADPSEADIMTLNLLAQHLMDSVASRSIIEIFGPVVSNTELHNWLLWQSAFEGIHASTYSKIFRSAYADGNEALERGKHNLEVFNRSKRIGQVFNQLARDVSLWNLSDDLVTKKPTKDEMKLSILKGFVTLYCLEQISFMSSFAATFALVETGRYQVIGKSLSSICNDEMVHAIGDRIVVEEMLSEPSDDSKTYRMLLDENRSEFQEIVDAIVQQEMDWSVYLFSEGRKAIGLNTEILQEYSNYCAQPVYNFLGLTWNEGKHGPAVRENPLPYMDRYMYRDKVQTANQEVVNNNYRVGQVVNDLDGLDLSSLME